ncbi:hypothetical protein ACVWYH_010304 [Bradyrhizobium sp. GM24.11]
MKWSLTFSFQRPRFAKPDAANRPGLLARLLRNDEGSIIVYMTIAVPVLIGIAALGSEGGFWLYQKRMLQSAADNAAYSAAAAYGADKTADITGQARAITANDYGLVNGQNNVTVAVNRPPSGSCNTGIANYTGSNAIEVIVTKPQPPRLSGIWLSSDVNICGRGVALVPAKGDCILALAPTGKAISSIGKINNLAITLNDCSIFSDSTSSNSISFTGNNNTIDAYAVGTAGGIDLSGNAKSKISNATTGNPPVADPYKSDAASLWVPTQTPAPTLPTVKSCSGSSCNPGTAIPTTGCNSATTVTLSQGTWSAASLIPLKLSQCSTAINLSGGTYVFPAGFDTTVANGPLTIQAASQIVVTGGALKTKTVTFSSGNNHSIYINGGSWAIGGNTTFGNGNFNIAIIAGSATNTGNWTISSGTNDFGTGNHSITIQGNAFIDTGNWNISGGTNTFGGTNTIALTGGTAANTNDWNISGGTNTFNGTYSVALTGTGTATTGNLNISTNTTLGTGIYYVSGNINLTGNNETVTANNATFVLTGNTSAISSTGNHQTWTITAPTTGWNAGIAIWEPNSTGSNLIATGNNSTATITGVIYAPQADVQYVGNSGNTPTCTQIVAKTVEFGGNSISITGDCPGVPGLKLFGQIAALVE